jgi:hypothetical protein
MWRPARGPEETQAKNSVGKIRRMKTGGARLTPDSRTRENETKSGKMNPRENKNREARTKDSTRNTPDLEAASTKQNGDGTHERKTEFLLHKNQTRFHIQPWRSPHFLPYLIRNQNLVYDSLSTLRNVK